MNQYVIGGIVIVAILAVAAFVTLSGLRPSKPAALPEPERPAYTVTVFDGGKQVATWDAHRYSTGDGRLYGYLPNSKEAIVVGGTYVLEPMQAPEPGVGQKRWRVTVYSGGEAVKIWEADHYSTGEHRMYVYLPGAEKAIVIGGPYVVEPIR